LTENKVDNYIGLSEKKKRPVTDQLTNQQTDGCTQTALQMFNLLNADNSSKAAQRAQ